MTLPAYLTIFFLGSLFGAALMLVPLERALNLNKLQKEARKFWFNQYLVVKSKAIDRQKRLDEIHAQHVAAGKARHAKERARIVETASAIPFQPLRPRDEVVADIRQRREALKVAV